MEQELNNELAELDVMRTLAEALEGLDEGAQARVLKWACDRYKIGPLPKMSPALSVPPHKLDPQPGQNEQEEGDLFADLPTLYSAANPRTQSEKALIVGFWLQLIQGQSDLDSFEINKRLKNLGHGAANITRALEDLIAVRPQLVIQTRKSGTSKQARKKYRLTAEGISRVKQMLARGVNASGNGESEVG
jgi:hypothetical protein